MHRSARLFLPVCAVSLLALAANADAQTAAADQFDRWDRDGDGRLTREELPEASRRNFNRVDADGDGFISRAEHQDFRRRDARPAQSAARPAARASDSVTAHRDLPYAGTEHPRQRLDLYLPKNPAADRLPLVVFIHGGAWRAGDKSGGGRQVSRFVESGKYAGASIGYRLSSDAVWPAQIHDCKAAIRWLRAHADEYGLDPDRIGVMGSSAGGHLVAMLGTSGGVEELEGDLGGSDDQSSRVACVVDLYGPSELLSMGDSPSRLDHNAPDSPESLLLGGVVQERQDLARQASPITFVSHDDPPFLIIHGSDDPTVPYGQSVRLDAALKEAGVASTLIKVEGGGHGGFNNPEIDARVQVFFDKHLLGKDAEVSADPVKSGRNR